MIDGEEVVIWMVQDKYGRRFYVDKRNAEKRVASQKGWDARFPGHNSGVRMYKLVGILEEV